MVLITSNLFLNISGGRVRQRDWRRCFYVYSPRGKLVLLNYLAEFAGGADTLRELARRECRN